jgi:hypothetical protein
MTDRDVEMYRDLAKGVRMIRLALGAGILPVATKVKTPLQDCESIAQAIYKLKGEHMAKTHKVTKAEVVKLRGDDYGIRFEFDDGTIVQEPVWSRSTPSSTPASNWARIARPGATRCC